MSTAISGLDHVVIGVDDLDRAADAYRKLGFALSPRAVHSAAMGTANHTIMLEHDYFELLAVLTPTDRNQRWAEAIAKGQGIVGVAAATPSAAAAREAWRAAGLAPSDVVGFSRPVERPGGITTEARFEITSLPKDSLPGASLFACSQLTRDAVWLPELMAHPNTASAIRKVTISVPDPLEASRAWLRAMPGAASLNIPGGICVRLASHLIDLLEPPVAAERYRLARVLDRTAKSVALDLAVGSVDACRTVLAKSGATATVDDGRIVIGADHACGIVITMVSSDAPLE